MEAGEASQGMLLPDAAAEHVEGEWGHVKGARAAEGEKGGRGLPDGHKPM